MPGFAVYAPPDPPTLHDKPQQAPQFMQVMQAAADDICAINHVVISEFRTRGPNGGNDEFVELFNVSPVAVDISGWQVWGSNSTGSSLSSRITISSPVMLAPTSITCSPIAAPRPGHTADRFPVIKRMALDLRTTAGLP